MMFVTLTTLVLIHWVLVDSSIPDVKCHVANYTVHLQIQLNTTIRKDTQVVLQTHKFYIPSLDPEIYRCQIGEERNVVNCSVWQEENEQQLIKEYFNTHYQLKVVEESSNTVLWSRDMGELNQLMYDCFTDHRITRLKITCGDCVTKYHSDTSLKTTQCRHLQWQRQKHDVNYELISSHTINIGSRLVTNDVNCDHLSALCVYHNLHNLNECDPEDVCINTIFKAPYSGLGRRNTECISTRHMCNRNKCTRKKPSSHFRLIVSITLSGAAIIMIALAGITVHRRYKQRQVPSKTPADDDDDDDFPIKPRSKGDNGDSLCPRNDHDYAYPELVLSDNQSEVSEYSEVGSENFLIYVGSNTHSF